MTYEVLATLAYLANPNGVRVGPGVVGSFQLDECIWEWAR